MTTATQSDKADNTQRWSEWSTLALERLPPPYWLTIALVGVVMVAEQVLEYSFDDPTFGHLTAGAVADLLVLPIMTVYILVSLRILKGWTTKGLARLRPTVLVSDQEV